jgi:membrane protein YdbS with pleckstrin-like domain
MGDSQKNLKTVLLVAQAFLLLVLGSLVTLLLVFGAPLFIWIMIAAVALLALIMVVRHARHTVYRCKACEHPFQVSGWIDFVSPHLGGVKLLRCPRCGAVKWCVAGRL